MNKVPEIIPISEMKLHQAKVVNMLTAGPVVLAQRSKPAAVMVSPDEWNKIAEKLEELESLRDIVAAYQTEIDIWNGDEEVKDIDLDALQAELDHAKVPA